MSALLRPTSLRVRTARIAVAGAAALASVLTIAPAAVADDAPPADTTGPADGTTSEPSVPEEPTTPVEETPGPTDETPGTTDETPGTTEETPGATGTPQTGTPQKSDVSAKAAEDAVEEVEPNFGSQKFRVGVKVADGSWVPPGTTTAGSTISITLTGPGEGDNYTFTCTTDASTIGSDAPTASFCLAPQASRSKAAAGGVEVGPDDSTEFQQMFYAPPGTTVTLSQTDCHAQSRS